MPGLAAALVWLASGQAAASVTKPSPVVVVHGQQALKEEGERRFALSLARHAVRWFREGGLTADMASDANLAGALGGRRVAVLVYCAQPTDGQMKILRRFAAQGGRLIVCYGMSPELAGLMGVRLTGYRRDAAGGRWSSMAFEQIAPPNTPRQIVQSSPNIFGAAPIAGSSRVLAWWVGRDGRRTPDAAWLKGPHGFWMTHVLLADGDARDKGRLLVALAADGDPALWREAARAHLADALAVGPWRQPAEARAAARGAGDRTRRTAARKAARQAEELLGDARRLLQAGRGAEAWLASDDLRRSLLVTYGLLQSPRAGEIRAVWDHSGQGLYPGDWPRTCRLLKEGGISDIMVNVASPGFSHCRLDALPASPTLLTQGDQLAACLEAARPLGLRVHAWLICFSTTLASPERLAQLQRQGMLLEGSDGRTRDWLDPAAPAARELLTRAAGELLRRYRVDGLHLDFARYPDYYQSLGPGVRKRFERSRGGAVPGNWPENVKRGAPFRELVRWRAGEVTALVARMRLTQRRVAPGAWLTAAVYGRYPTCVESIGQDWRGWIEQGYLDFVLPMNYSEDPALYGELVAAQTDTPRFAARLVGGIGVTASESRLDAAAVIDQVQVLRARAAAGFALFDLDATLARDILPVLRLGLTAQSASRGRGE